jgi:hypothetical protein
MALAFFRHVTVCQLPCALVTETPWERIALDLIHLEPSIAAAASACAGIHRAITNAREHNQWQFAMQQYSKSLSLVGKYIGVLRPKKTDDDVLVVLIACLLFFTFEVFSSQDQRASLHLQTGLQIIHERCRPSGKHSLTPSGGHFVIVKPRPNTLLEALVQVFVRQQEKSSVQLDAPPAFSLGSGMITCLVIIVERCRDSLIRRRCINVLQTINLRGIFDTDYLVAYLQAIVEHEEGLARVVNHHLGPDLRASDIPEAARVLEVVMSPSYHASNFEFYKRERVGIVYATGGHDIDGNGLRLRQKGIQMFSGGGIVSHQTAHSSTPLTGHWDISF